MFDLMKYTQNLSFPWLNVGSKSQKVIPGSDIQE